MVPSVAYAQKNSTTRGRDIRHAYKPFVVNQTGWMRARVNNVTMMPQARLVCVEAFRMSNAMKNHLGCLSIDWPMSNNWSTEYDAPTNMLSQGNYNVQYSYQDGEGKWHGVKSMDDQVMRGVVNR